MRFILIFAFVALPFKTSGDPIKDFFQTYEADEINMKQGKIEISCKSIAIRRSVKKIDKNGKSYTEWGDAYSAPASSNLFFNNNVFQLCVGRNRFLFYRAAKNQAEECYLAESIPNVEILEC